MGGHFHDRPCGHLIRRALNFLPWPPASIRNRRAHDRPNRDATARRTTSGTARPAACALVAVARGAIRDRGHFRVLPAGDHRRGRTRGLLQRPAAVTVRRHCHGPCTVQQSCDMGHCCWGRAGQYSADSADDLPQHRRPTHARRHGRIEGGSAHLHHAARPVCQTAAPCGTNIEIEHADSAGGIREDRRPRVFNLFFMIKDVGKGPASAIPSGAGPSTQCAARSKPATAAMAPVSPFAGRRTFGRWSQPSSAVADRRRAARLYYTNAH